MRKIDLSKMNVGDKVYSILRGVGTIESKSYNSSWDCQIVIKFESCKEEKFKYTKCGRLYETDLMPEIYLQPFDIKIPYKAFKQTITDYLNLKLDDKLLITRRRTEECFKFHFQQIVDEHSISVFKNGETSFTNKGDFICFDLRDFSIKRVE